MSTTVASTDPPRKHRPYVPETMEMKEFTFRAVLIGLFLTALLGSANAYLGLKAGDLPVSEQAAREVLALPMFPELTETEIGRVVESIADFYS